MVMVKRRVIVVTCHCYLPSFSWLVVWSMASNLIAGSYSASWWVKVSATVYGYNIATFVDPCVLAQAIKAQINAQLVQRWVWLCI